MLPEGYVTFFSVSAGAGAALVGLIFIAVSISPEKTVGKDAAVERTIQAESAFTALVNAFFVSLTAIPPTGGIGWGAVVLSIFALQSTGRSAFRIFREVHGWVNIARRLFLVIASFAIYGFEFFTSLNLLNSPNNPGSLSTLTSLVCGIFGIGIVRAWELFGADREFLFSIFGFIESLRLKISGSKEETAGGVSLETSPVQPVSASTTGPASIEKANPVQPNIAGGNTEGKHES